MDYKLKMTIGLKSGFQIPVRLTENEFDEIRIEMDKQRSRLQNIKSENGNIYIFKTWEIEFLRDDTAYF